MSNHTEGKQAGENQCIGIDINRCKPTYDELEKRVIERTAELTQANQLLKQEIAERKLAQEALSAQKEFLQTVIDTNPNQIFVKDRDGKYVLVNQAVAEFHGTTVENLLGKTDAQLSPNQAELPQFLAQDREALATLQQQFIPEQVDRTFLGEIRWFQLIKKPLLSSDGQVYQVLGVGTDITERKLAEEQLRQSEEQLRLTLEAAGMDSWNWDLKSGKITGATNFKRLYGYEYNPSGFTYEESLEIVHLEDRDRIRQANRQAIETGQGYSIEFRIIWPDGTIRWLESKGQVIYDQIGKPVRMTGINLDITERKLAEDQLHQREAQLRLALESARMGFWECNFPTGKVIWTNPLEQLSGLASNPEGSTYEDFLGIVHPEDRDRVCQADRHSLETGENFDIEFRIVSPDGDTYWIESKGQAIYDKTGKPLKMTGIDLDITERKLAETQIKASLREKEVLLQEIHHRVKNNLQVISSLLDLQSQRINDKTTLEMFQESQNRIKLMALVHETLYEYKNFAKINFSAYLKSLTIYLFRAYKIETSHITLELDFDEIYLNLDKAVPCGLIISELVSNSLKYAFPNQTNGKIRISVNCDEDGYIQLIIRDNGVGFPINWNFNSINSLGLQLVNVLINQIEGTLEFNNSQGVQFKISFRNQ